MRKPNTEIPETQILAEACRRIEQIRRGRAVSDQVELFNTALILERQARSRYCTREQFDDLTRLAQELKRVASGSAIAQVDGVVA